jgi:hypothetical protein
MNKAAKIVEDYCREVEECILDARKLKIPLRLGFDCRTALHVVYYLRRELVRKLNEG